jgi:subtilisin family serine protease
MVALKIVFALFLLSTPVMARTLTRYALLLQDPPAASARSVVRIAGSGPEVATAAAILREHQRALRAELLRRKFQVTGATQTLVNAIYVAADASRLDELSHLPGVRRVVFLPTLRPALDHAEQLVNLPGAWTVLGGAAQAGIGVKVAVIDSGIDYTHPAFQAPSLTPPPGFPICQPQDCGFTNNKIIVARSYLRQQGAGSPDDPARDSRPDDFSPRDREGHGTAVAMIIGGVTNSGPGDTITGFAPQVFLGSYKVFGTTGVNDNISGDVVVQALEDAVMDGMDIANLSLGGAPVSGALDTGTICGEPVGMPCDTLSQAIENATKLGMLVVVSAGNEGANGTTFPTLATAGTPGIAPSALSVAGTTNSHVWLPSGGGWTSIELSSYNTVASFSSRGPAIGTAAIKPEIAAVATNLFLTAQNYDPTGDLYNPSRYTISQGTSFSAPMVAGSAALVKQRMPAWQPPPSTRTPRCRSITPR